MAVLRAIRVFLKGSSDHPWCGEDPGMTSVEGQGGGRRERLIPPPPTLRQVAFNQLHARYEMWLWQREQLLEAKS